MMRGLLRLARRPRRDTGTTTTHHAATTAIPANKWTSERACLRTRGNGRSFSADGHRGGAGMPRAVSSRRIAVNEQPVPPLEAQQGPDEEAMVHLACKVLLEHTAHVRLLEVAA